MLVLVFTLLIYARFCYAYAFGDRRTRDRMVVGFTAMYAIREYHH